MCVCACVAGRSHLLLEGMGLRREASAEPVDDRSSLCVCVYVYIYISSQNCLKSVLLLGGLRLGIADTLARAVALAGQRRQKPGHLVPCVVAALSD